MSQQTYIPANEFVGSAPEVAQQEDASMSRLETALRDFNDYWERISNVRFGAAIGRLAGTPEGNALNVEYGRELARAENMKQRIEGALGAWDTVKGWIGLGALPLIPIAVTLGLITAIGAVVQAGRGFLRRADIKLAIAQDPHLSYEDAANQVDAANQGSFGKTFGKAIDVAQLGLAALLVWGVYKFFRG